jgi:DNA repair ATPase RecN
MKILSIAINNSEFFHNDFKIDFSNKLNCLMGGRGTGKSTIVHLIDACLNKLAQEDPTTKNILMNNLGQHGEVELFFELDGEKYSVKKNIDTDPICIKYSDKQVVDINRLFNQVDIFKALKIEEIGRNAVSRLELIDMMIANDVRRCKNSIRDITSKLEQNARELVNENDKLNDVKDALALYDDIDSELKHIESARPSDLNENQLAEYERAKQLRNNRDIQVNRFNEIQSKIWDVHNAGMGAITRIDELQEVVGNSQTAINDIKAEQLLGSIKSYSETFRTMLFEQVEKIIILSNANEEAIAELQKVQISEEETMKKMIAAIAENKNYYEKLDVLEKKKLKRDQLNVNCNLVGERINVLRNSRESLMHDFRKERQKLFELRLNVVTELNQRFENKIRITMLLGGLNDNYKEKLKNVFKGKGMRYNVILDKIIAAFVPDKFANILLSKDSDMLYSIAGIDRERAQDVFTAFNKLQDVYDIESIYCDDLPQFYLLLEEDGVPNIDAKNYKPTEELSTGQRCTAVLPIVFEVSINPLIIDQPEDNLDNKYISDKIHSLIRDLKKRRQLIFITHNPNIPVLADAEFNIFLEYANAKSRVSVKGSVEDVKNNILTVLEGGEAAFRKREQLYSKP